MHNLIFDKLRRNQNMKYVNSSSRASASCRRWARIQCKPIKKNAKNARICFVFFKNLGLAPELRCFPRMCHRRAKIPKYPKAFCISKEFGPRGTKTTIFPRIWSMDPLGSFCCNFQGYFQALVVMDLELQYFARILHTRVYLWPQTQRLRQPSLSHHTWETRLRDKGAHTCARNFLLEFRPPAKICTTLLFTCRNRVLKQIGAT